MRLLTTLIFNDNNDNIQQYSTITTIIFLDIYNIYIYIYIYILYNIYMYISRSSATFLIFCSSQSLGHDFPFVDLNYLPKSLTTKPFARRETKIFK